jgi:hypothetical protein
MAKKIVLPLLGELAKREPAAGGPRKKPSIDAARARLGGRPKDAGPAPPGLAPGTIVRARAAEAGSVGAAPGVVVFASAREVHVLFDGSRLKRLGPEDVEAARGCDAPATLANVAADARVFWLLAEGQSVRWADGGGSLRDGKLVEKCRYGALVLRGDGAIVAVGFRKLWPAAGEADA